MLLVLPIYVAMHLVMAMGMDLLLALLLVLS